MYSSVDIKTSGWFMIQWWLCKCTWQWIHIIGVMVRNSILQYTMINNCVHVTLFSVAVNRARFRHRHLALAA